jgi:hypothetical protein
MSQVTSFWAKNGAHLLLYTTSALALVAQYAPALVPSGGIAAAAVATALLGVIHQFNGKSQPPAAPLVKMLVLFTCGLLLVGGLQGCKTVPTAQQQSLITAAVDVATGAAIQHGTSDPVVWTQRAAKYKAIATQLQQINAAGSLTLATLAADLQPQIAKLGPADALAANALVAALTPFVQQQIAANPSVGNAQTVISAFLDAVIQSCTVYGG